MSETGSRPAIFITGAASGIGRETARLFAGKGWLVGAADIDRGGLDRLEQELGAQSCHVGVLDVTRRGDWDGALTSFAAASGGRMDLFFNNAGIGHGGFFEEVPEEIAAKIVGVNLQGVVNGIYACLPLLKETAAARGIARIVNTGSASGIIGGPRLAVYAATKFAVRGLTDSLFVEFGRYGIEVTELQPWFLDTAILNSVENEDGKSGRERLEERNVKVFAADLAAKAVWDTVQAKTPVVHRAVGGPARMTQILAQFMPNRTRRRIARQLLEAIAAGE
jgi:NAD(P)-dependent dehydrogenase (short-subunit alcohol dehydrogenase family)